MRRNTTLEKHLPLLVTPLGSETTVGKGEFMKPENVGENWFMIWGTGQDREAVVPLREKEEEIP
jgi:hypothetical protein